MSGPVDVGSVHSHTLANAGPASVFVIDEPENSLHPNLNRIEGRAPRHRRQRESANCPLHRYFPRSSDQGVQGCSPRAGCVAPRENKGEPKHVANGLARRSSKGAEQVRIPRASRRSAEPVAILACTKSNRQRGGVRHGRACVSRVALAFKQAGNSLRGIVLSTSIHSCSACRTRMEGSELSVDVNVPGATKAVG